MAGKYEYALVAVLTIVVLPVLLHPLPPLLDFPNHMARLWLLQDGVHEPPLDRFYTEDWHGIGTNIGIDLMAKALWFIPAFPLARVLLVLAMVLPPAGAIALNLMQFRRPGPWLVAFAYLCFTETVLAGFLNYQIGLGTALFATSADSLVAKMWPRRAFRLVCASVLLVIHPFALLFYCILLAATEFGAGWPTWNVTHLMPRLLRAAEAAVCLVPLVLFLARNGLPGDARVHVPFAYNPALLQIGTLVSPFLSYSSTADILFAFPFLAVLFYAIADKRITVHAGLITAAAILAIAAPFMPPVTYESGWIDHRLPLMAVLAALAGTHIALPEQRSRLLLAAAVALIGLRTAWISWNWAAGDAMWDSIRRATVGIPPGAAVYPMQHLPTKADLTSFHRGRILGKSSEAYWHYAVLLVPLRHAFVPSLFAEPGKQPIKVRPPYDKIAQPGGGDLPSTAGLRDPQYLSNAVHDWWRFDYVLVLNADRPDRYGPVTMPRALKLVRDEGFAQLFKIEKASGPAHQTPAHQTDVIQRR